MAMSWSAWRQSSRPTCARASDRLRHTVDEAIFNQLSPFAPSTGVISLAERPAADLRALLGERRAAPIVLLEDPRDLGNMGACVRVAAAADIAGVLTTGSHDPWHPDALRGAAGLHFALPVARLEGLERARAPGQRRASADRDGSGGAPLDPAGLPPRAILAFGTERQGLSDKLLEGADARLAIPMRTGVSSLNLATSVAAVLFAWRLTPEKRFSAGRAPARRRAGASCRGAPPARGLPYARPRAPHRRPSPRHPRAARRSARLPGAHARGRETRAP